MLRAFFLAFLALAALASAQVINNSTVLAPSSAYGTSAFVPVNTFTPVTTFSQAGSVAPTTLIGVGPSITPGAATFSYSVPVSTVSGYAPTSVLSSLASKGLPTDAKGPIAPPASPDLIVPNQNAAASLTASSIAVFGISLAAGAAFLLA